MSEYLDKIKANEEHISKAGLEVNPVDMMIVWALLEIASQLKRIADYAES